MNNGPDTIKIRINYRAELERAEQELAENPANLDKGREVLHLREKVRFYDSQWYQHYKQDKGDLLET